MAEAATMPTTYMSKPLIPIDLTKSPKDQVLPLHNRWHPDIPPVVTVKPGDVFRVECYDWTGGQIKNDDSANDIRDVELPQVHYLSGPIAVEGAEPGDILVVDIIDIGALVTSPWGFTGIFAKTNGGGSLTEHYPDAKKVIWDLQGINAVSRHIKNVKFAGLSHPGLIGCAPSAELLAMWNTREAELIATNPNRVPPLAAPPIHKQRSPASCKGLRQRRWRRKGRGPFRHANTAGTAISKISRAATKSTSPSSSEVAISPWGTSTGHSGDGEISFCGAIEMSGYLDLQVDLIKGGVSRYGMINPIFKPGPVEPRYSEYLVFEGISVDEQGKQYYLDPHIAYRVPA